MNEEISTSDQKHDNDFESSSTMEQMEIMEDSIPPLSSYVSTWRFWWQFFKWPAVFVVLNVVILTALVHVDQGKYPSQDEQERVFKSNCLVIAVLCIMDALVLYKAKRFMEHDIAARDGVEQDESQESSHHIHAQVSRKLDCFLRRGRRPRLSILVSLLYIAYFQYLAISLTYFGFWVLAQSPKTMSVCSGRPQAFENNKKLAEKLPSGLQTWAGDALSNENYRTTL